MSAYDNVLDAIRAANVRTFETSAGVRAQCPAHQSRGLSLALRPAQKDDGPVGLKCFAGCTAAAVLEVVGLGLKDLYEPKEPRTVQRVAQFHPRPKPTPFEEMIPNPEHLCDRILQQEALEASPAYHQHLADLAEWAKPRPGDYAGGPSGDWEVA